MPELKPSAVSEATGWGAYLGCSWTWCIGMFLPVLLIRDFGPLGFVVFAVPNVIGAAAMGWLLRDGAASRRLVDRHRVACSAFTAITIAFHVFWLAWLGAGRTPHAGPDDSATLLVGGVALAAGFGLGLATRRRPWPSLVQWLLSVTALAVLLWRVRLGDTDAVGYVSPFRLGPSVLPMRDLVWLAPVCCFGFALCPYLDLTFHRGRQACTPAGGRAAFSLGFGFFFAAMILFTPLYAGIMLSGYSLAIFSLAVAAVIVHLCSQAGFTIAAHGSMVVSALRSVRRWGVACAVVAAPLAIGLAVAPDRAGTAVTSPWTPTGLTAGEKVYRAFMAFYGLYFPAYVWLCVIPTPDGHSGPSRGKVAVWAAACALATPCYWLGFIERETWWLAPGLGIVLAARLAARAIGQSPGRSAGR